MDLAKAIDFAVKAGFGNYAYEAAGIFHELVNEVEKTTLEKAAQACDDRLSHWKMVRDLERGCAAHDCASSIRALKPVLEKDNT